MTPTKNDFIKIKQLAKATEYDVVLDIIQNLRKITVNNEAFQRGYYTSEGCIKGYPSLQSCNMIEYYCHQKMPEPIISICDVILKQWSNSLEPNTSITPTIRNSILLSYSKTRLSKKFFNLIIELALQGNMSTIQEEITAAIEQHQHKSSFKNGYYTNSKGEYICVPSEEQFIAIKLLAINGLRPYNNVDSIKLNQVSRDIIEICRTILNKWGKGII